MSTLTVTRMEELISSSKYKYDLIILDPPFGKCVKANWDDKTFTFTSEILNNLYDRLSDEGSLYIHCGMGEKSNSLIKWFLEFEKSKFYFKDVNHWEKIRGFGQRLGPLQISEHILWYVKNNKKFRWNKENQYSDEKRLFNIVKKGGIMVNKSEYKRFTTNWKIPELGYGKSPKFLKEIKKYITHLTPKNPRISDRMIKFHCNKNSRILIPFVGSGMEVVSCLYNNLEYDACDNDKYNIDFINQYIITKKIKFEDFI